MCTMVLLELYHPTFGKCGRNKILGTDIKMPADDYCLYHCFSYARSNGTAALSQTMRSDYRKELLLAYVVMDYQAKLHDY